MDWWSPFLLRWMCLHTQLCHLVRLKSARNCTDAPSSNESDCLGRVHSNSNSSTIFFEDTVNGDRYLALLRDHVVPYLRKKRLLSKVTYQQDGAPPHIKKCVTDFLRQHFGTRVISRLFDNPWPPRSPDLTPADFWFGGSLKRRVYRRSPASLEELEQFITEEMLSISSDELQRSCQSVLSRLEILKNHGGGHIDHLWFVVWTKYTPNLWRWQFKLALHVLQIENNLKVHTSLSLQWEAFNILRDFRTTLYNKGRKIDRRRPWFWCSTFLWNAL